MRQREGCEQSGRPGRPVVASAPKWVLATAGLSLPRSQVEMSDFDLVGGSGPRRRCAGSPRFCWLASDDVEVVRRRLFDAVGAERARKERASKTYADWCFERRTRLPPAWTLG